MLIKKEFNSVEEAQIFIDAINLQLGIPSSENSVTQSYTDYIEENGKFFVEYDDTNINFEL